MDKLKKARTYTRSAFTRAHTQFVNECSKEPIRLREVNVYFNLLKEKARELEVMNEKIFTLMIDSDTDEAEVNIEIESVDEYKTRFIQAEVDAAAINESLKQLNATQGNSVNQESSKRNYTLPKIQFQKYGGDLKGWLHFWGQFNKIHEDVSMSKDDKFYYLSQHILPDSKASELVGSFPPVGAMYDQVIQSLKNRFGRDELLVEFYVRDLLKLVLTNAMKSNEKIQLSNLYDQLETHIRSLESLGVNTDTCSAMLYPLVESSLPEDILRTWQRQSSLNNIVPVATAHATAEVNNEVTTPTSKDRLVKLMNFLRTEVENEQRISMAMSGFGLKTEEASQPVFKSNNKKRYEQKNGSRHNVPTAATLLTTREDNMTECVFCNSNHESSQCGMAKNLSLQERQEAVKRKKVCFNCLKPRHTSRWCKSNEKCAWCGGKHVLLMCRNFKLDGTVKPASSSPTKMTENNLANLSVSTEVFLQTLCVKLRNQNKERVVRAVLDTGSHRSYILSKAARDLGYEPIGQQKVVHMLFGGTTTPAQDHHSYQVHLVSLNGTYACNFMALSQDKICQDIPSIGNGPWLQELQRKKILLTDVQRRDEPISLLLGADVIGKLSTGNLINLECGPTAMETKLGWTLMGKNLSKKIPQYDSTLITMSMFIQEANVSDLWSLDVLGITDPTQTKSKEIHQAEVKEKFRQTTKLNDEGRYEVLLPWKENHPELTDNKAIAEKRLENTTKRLEAQNLRQNYQSILDSWLAEGIIEEVPDCEIKEYGYYLPHRHVIKENSTTPIRPVFDASARGKNSISLNQCLETGPNLIELIPTMLMRFREKKIGVIADIEKAFLQISISPKDRNCLRFLWWNKMHPGEVKVYRHRRVVFGVSSSPFLLGATIELHLERAIEEASIDKHSTSIQQLSKSFYVDNCVSSVDTPVELDQFIKHSTSIMKTGGFNLRGWEYNGMRSANNQTSILGILWDKQEDFLMLNLNHLEEPLPELITKRVILSATQKIFDPIGIVCPVLLLPKLLLQKLWSKSLTWDEEVEHEVKRDFCQWRKQAEVLRTLRIPRWLFQEPSAKPNISLHVFVDASQDAYAAALFARTETSVGVKLQLIEAKSRVAPTTKTTIPRLELLAATIGARLMKFTSTILEKENVDKYYWTDSSTVLSWIQRENQWATFVWNRVQEIRQISEPHQWRHITGVLNPADLPSRGCTAKQLIDSRWWEGPEWLKGKPDEWPISEFLVNEEEIIAEMKKTVSRGSLKEKDASAISSQQLLQQNMSVKTKLMVPSSEISYWYLGKLSKYTKILRVMAWIKRFISNSRLMKEESENRTFGEISVQEITLAESTLMRLTQQDTFEGVKDPKISCLGVYMDESGLIRLKTPISNRKDKLNFRFPIVLDPRHPLVTRLIEYKHQHLNHAGVQIVMNCLREHVWVLTSRRAIRSVIQRCNTCKRYNASHFKTVPAPLPEARTRDAAVFEVTGIDYTGPLYLKGGQKVWICLFTCAVYRAVHLELVGSLSTIAFLEVIRRFIARRGRPSIIYSDNGTNFSGTNNLLNKIDWNEVNKYGTLQKIEWRFNPPTAAWWGGWWERLIRTVKELLRKVLRRACLTYEEMITVLCDCESIVNSRPITYLSEDPSQLSPLTPAMFLQDIADVGVLDLDLIDKNNLHRRIRYRHKIREDLRKRFRLEYLGQLSRKGFGKEDERTIREGDVVLISNDNQKRIDWPLGLVIETIPGIDGHVRIVRLKTSSGELIRPVQKLYLLEMNSSDIQIDKVCTQNTSC